MKASRARSAIRFQTKAWVRLRGDVGGDVGGEDRLIWGPHEAPPNPMQNRLGSTPTASSHIM